MHCASAAALVLAVASGSGCAEGGSSKGDDGGRAEPSVASSAASGPDAGGPPVAESSLEIARAQQNLLAELRRGDLLEKGRTLEAIAVTPRHLFAPELSLYAAYQDRPQPIGHGQTISQPTIVGMMTQALELTGSERVLEIGTGSGYQAAVLARLARHVSSIEIVPALGEAARDRLARLGYTNVEVRIGDGYLGWPDRAPFDRIIVTAAPPDLPRALVEQLAVGGILVAPIGETERVQRLIRLRKTESGVLEEDLGAVRFVPMVPGREP